MTKIRLLPVVVMAIAALLVLKTLGLVTNGGYVLTGVGVAQAAGASTDAGTTTEADLTVTPAGEPTMEDTSPTLADDAPTLGAPAEAGEIDAALGDLPAIAGPGAVPPAGAMKASGVYCREADATLTETGELILKPVAGEDAEHAEPAVVPEGSFANAMEADCLPSGDVVPMQLAANGGTEPLSNASGTTATEQQVLERLAARRTELQRYEQDLALRSSIVDAAEKRIEERAATLAALEAQISSLVDQRTEMEAGQFAGIVAMYEAMKPKDAAKIFNNLDMDVLLRVAKTIAPRKMAPILAAMEPARAQDLTVKMAALADRPATEMTTDDLAALPQIVGQ
ncbi:MotE family protein [Devosia sp. A449]